MSFAVCRHSLTPHLKIPLVWEVPTPDDSRPVDRIRPGLFFHQKKKKKDPRYQLNSRLDRAHSWSGSFGEMSFAPAGD